MKRVLALSVAVSYFSVATAFAQEPMARNLTVAQPVTFAPAAPTPTPTPRLSLIPATAQVVKTTAMAAPKPLLVLSAPRNVWAVASAVAANPKASKSFWKTPWPYVIAGVVVAGVVIAKRKGYSNNSGACPPGQEATCSSFGY